jgi:hypothetical protein
MLGADVRLEDLVNLALCTLVGHLSYRSMCKTSIVEWVQNSWWPLLGYETDIFYMTRGWFGFRFKNSEDTSLIMDRF